MLILKMSIMVGVGVGLAWLIGARPMGRLPTQPVDGQLLTLSEKLLYAVKTEQPTDSIETQLTTYSAADLERNLGNDKARKTFWINLYNAWYQILATQKKLKAPRIFSDKSIRFADVTFSLDDVEHGILRRYRWKYGLGYLPQFFPGKTIKTLAVDTVDFRVHFALNCGAKSCPPIAFYTYDKLDDQLTIATRSYLKNETVVDSVGRKAYVPKLMQWFKGDFGGTTGIRSILSANLGQNFSTYRIQYRDYNWSEDLRNFEKTDNAANP